MTMFYRINEKIRLLIKLNTYHLTLVYLHLNIIVFKKTTIILKVDIYIHL